MQRRIVNKIEFPKFCGLLHRYGNAVEFWKLIPAHASVMFIVRRARTRSLVEWLELYISTPRGQPRSGPIGGKTFIMP